MNVPLLPGIEAIGTDLGTIQKYMRDNDIDLMVYPENMSYELSVKSFKLIETLGFAYGSANTTSELAKLSDSELEKEYMESFGNGFNIKLYSAQVIDYSGRKWLEGYYHISGESTDNNVLNYDYDDGQIGLSVRLFDYSGQSLDSLRSEWRAFANSVTFTDSYASTATTIESANPIAANPTLPAIPPAQKASPKSKTIDMTTEESYSTVEQTVSDSDSLEDLTLFKQDGTLHSYWWFYLIILFIFTFLLQCFPFIVYRYVIVKHPVSRKKAKKIVIIYMSCLFMVLVGLELLAVYQSGYESSSAESITSPLISLIVWGGIGIKILTARNKRLKRAGQLIDKLENIVRNRFKGNILNPNDQIMVLGIFSCVASVLVEGIKRDYPLSEELIDAAKEQALIKTNEKEWAVEKSFIDRVNEKIRDITLSQDRSGEGWLDEMFHKYASVTCEYIGVKDNETYKSDIINGLDDVYDLVDTHVGRITNSDSNTNYCRNVGANEIMDQRNTSRGFFSQENDIEILDENSSIFEDTDATENEQYYTSDALEKDDVRNTLSDEDLFQIKKWKNLYDSGVITEEEFMKKRKDILHIAEPKSPKLITCPDCGRKVSTQATICPNCGKPLKKTNKLVLPSMNKKRSIIAAIILAIGCIALFIVRPWEENKWIEKADKSVLFIGCYDSNNAPFCSGSGFLLFDGRTVVTNYHVIEGANTIKVYTNNNVEYDVKNIRNSDKDSDLAILTLSENTGLHPLSVGNSSKVKKGDEVVAIGSPEGLQNSVSTGVLSGRTDIDLQFTAPISHGSSGGALFNSDGEVIGVTYSFLEEGQSLNFAIPIEEVVYMYYHNE